jgi:hypothetical protein
MLMSIIVLVLIAAIAYYHYVEGFFSSAISAIVAMLAALGAFSLHEPVAQLLINQKLLPDQSDAIAIVLLFALMYFLPRLLIDKMVPGNIRLPVLVDKIGAPLLGLFAGAMALGIMSIAMQELPFGSAVGGYGRYSVLPDRQVSIIKPRENISSMETISDEVAEPVIGSDYGVSSTKPMHHVWQPTDSDNGRWLSGVPPQNHLAIPVDDMVCGLVSRAGQGGLGGDNAMDAVHPDFLLELFAQRLGIEGGQRHTTANLGSSQECAVSAIFLPTEKIPVTDDFVDAIRTSQNNDPPVPTLRSFIQAGDEYRVLVVRTTITDPNGDIDADKIMRMSASSMRLCMPLENTAVAHADFYPEGTLAHQGGNRLMWNKPSDPLFLDFSGGSKPKTIDWVFMLPPESIKDNKIPAGTFIEFKRNARVTIDAGPAPVMAIAPADDKDGVLRDGWTQDALDKLRAAPPAAPAVPAAAQPAGAQPPQPVPDIKQRVAPALNGGNGL